MAALDYFDYPIEFIAFKQLPACEAVFAKDLGDQADIERGLVVAYEVSRSTFCRLTRRC